MAREKTFAERMGAVAPPLLGLQDAPTHLRVTIWNAVERWLFESDDEYATYQRRMRYLYNKLHWPTDEVPPYSHVARTRVKSHVLSQELVWHEFYQFVDHVPTLYAIGEEGYERSKCVKEMTEVLDFLLEQEGSPYRFVDGALINVTNEEELASVREAAAPDSGRFAPAREHITQAVKHLAKKPEPAYDDSIKQSISAVESVLRIATSETGAKMSSLLAAFEAKYGSLHGSFRSAIEKLYGYASDEQGVRHGATAPVTVGSAEARCMLVMCSALVNFVIQRTQ